MSVSFEKKETNRGVLTFTISQEQIKPELDRVFNSVKKTINVPGFRKGHLPRPVFNQKFGEEALYQDALNNLLPNAYEAAVKEAGIEVVAQPKIDVVSMEKGQDWTISAEVVTKPEVKLGAYKDLEVSVEVSKEVTDEDVDARIERERNNLAELVLKEGPAAEGDTVVIDFVGSVDGVEFDGGKGDNFSLGLGSGQFIPGFEEQIVGHNVGDEFDVNVKFPEDYHEDSLKGQDAKFECKINSIKEKVLPELDDEFVKDVSEFDTLDEYKKDIKEHLEKDNEQRQLVEKQNKSVEALIDATEITVPESMIDNEVNRQFQDFARRVQQMGLNTDQYFQITNTSEEDVKNELRANAELKVKGDLVLEKYIEKEAIESTDEELDEQLKEFAKVYGQDDEEKFIEEFKNSPNVEFLKEDIKRKKALEKLVENTKFETKKAEDTKEDK